jgi:hypothetical protein
MARKTETIVSYVDDIDGTSFPEGKGEAFDITVNGKRYTLDLGSKNAKAFRDALGPWLAAAHELAPRVSGGKSGSADANNIRAFANENGVKVAEVGRLSATIRQAWVDAGSPVYDENGVRVETPAETPAK